MEEINLYKGKYLFDSKHVFSHRIWNMHVYLLEDCYLEDYTYYPIDQLEQLPIAVAHQKILTRFLP
ncbi:MAG: NUDIX domain-containing protein [Erysipelotrichaceae bacterium]|nr:NUDIX domain-containing protein [Erysipelotrichaceae bacterium]